MAKKTNDNKNQGLILALCAAIIVIVIVVVAIIAIKTNGNNGLVGLNDSYFVSDGAKYVLDINMEEIYLEEGLPTPTKCYLVYNYSGDEITGLKTYYLYDNLETAETAYEYLLQNDTSYYDSINLDGNYVILTHPSSDYDGTTASDIKLQVELIETMKQLEQIENAETTIDTEGTEGIEGSEGSVEGSEEIEDPEAEGE